MKRFPMRIRAGRRWVGPGSPCLLVAEIGLNHNGDYRLAQRLVRAAARAGADAVKFQNYRTEDFLSDRKLTYRYLSRGRWVTEPQWDMFKRCEAPDGWWPKLKKLCQREGVLFFSTPTSKQGVDPLVQLKVPFLKNGSDYLTHLPLLEYMGRTGIPVIVSTGMAEERDIEAAVGAVRRGGRSALVLLHCTSTYPTPPGHVNLRRMIALRDRFQTPVGFSDHTEGAEAAVQAVTLGAILIEKHFTLDHRRMGPDHRFSSTPDEFRRLVQRVREAEQRLGQAALRPDVSERAGRKGFRLSAVALNPLPAGTRLTENVVAFRRPGLGMSPAMIRPWLGKIIRRPVASGHVFHREDFRS